MITLCLNNQFIRYPGMLGFLQNRACCKVYNQAAELVPMSTTIIFDPLPERGKDELANLHGSFSLDDEPSSTETF